MAKRRGSRRSDRAEARGRPAEDVLREARAARYDALEAFDRRYVGDGVELVAGVDEAGRGALAGPVVAAAVVLPRDTGLHGVFDSKQVAEREREALFADVVARAISVGIAFSHPVVIDRDNILNATLGAMRRAVAALRPTPDLILVDGRDAFEWPRVVVPVKKGDGQSLAIAAASIVAKVARDRAMRRLHARFPQYRFEENKGYGTRDHIEAIVRHGAASVHRRTFLVKIVENSGSLL